MPWSVASPDWPSQAPGDSYVSPVAGSYFLAMLTMPSSLKLFFTLSLDSTQPWAAPLPKHLSGRDKGQKGEGQYKGTEASEAL